MPLWRRPLAVDAVHGEDRHLPRNDASALANVRAKRPKIRDDVRGNVLKAIEGGMSCREAATHCGVSLASAIRFAKQAGLTDSRAKAKANFRDKVVKAVEKGMTCREAAARYGVGHSTAMKWAADAGIRRNHQPPNKISDKIRAKVIKAVESGMTCRQAAAHCGVSLASAIRFAKESGLTDKRAKAQKSLRDKVLKAVEKGMPCRDAAARFGVSPTAAAKWAVKAGLRPAPASLARIGDDVREKVIQAVESGMSCRQAGPHYGVSLASAIRWTKHLRA